MEFDLIPAPQGWYLLSSFLIMPWVVFALMAALTDACVGFVDEWLLNKLKHVHTHKVHIDASGRLILISGFFGYVVSLLSGILALSSFTPTVHDVPMATIFQALGAGFLEVVWLIPYFYALNRGGAINTTPLFQTVPIFSLFFGLILFTEIPTLTHLVATVFLITGAFILNYKPTTGQVDIKAVILMLFASATISIGYFIFKDATLSGNFLAAIFWNGLGMGIFSTALYALYKPFRIQLDDFIRNANVNVLIIQTGNETLYAVHSLFNLAAVVLAPSIMVASAMNAFHPIFTLCIGITLAVLGSRHHRMELHGSGAYVKTVGILLIAFGTVLIAMP